MTDWLKVIAARAKPPLLYLLGFAGMRREDTLLVSFPRSGNTWVRFLLGNLISLCEWNGKKVDFTLLNQTMPELGVSNLLAAWPHSAIPRVIKTHRSYLPLFRGTRSIGLIRDPRDVMVSFYHYTRDRKGIYTGTFGEFIRSPHFGLESWFKHYLSWRDHWVLTIKYEELKENTLHEFNRMLDILRVDYPEAIVREAVSRSSIADTRQAERLPLSAPSREAIFARNGASRQWVAYFNEQDLAYYYYLSKKFGVLMYIDSKTDENC